MKERFEFVPYYFEITTETISTGWNMPISHYHEHYEIYILSSGKREVTIGATTYPINAQQATLFPSYTAHSSCGQSAFSGICIHFNLKYLQQYFSSLAIDLMLRCFSSPVISLDTDSYTKIQNIALSFCTNVPHNFCYLADILTLLGTCAKTPVSCNTQLAACADSDTKKSDLIIAYIDSNYTTIQNIMEIAEHLSVSPSYIHTTIKQRFNQSPKDYINALRLQHACRRLTYSSKTIHQIAFECGYTTYEYFVRLFKRKIGCTPSDYRLQ